MNGTGEAIAGLALAARRRRVRARRVRQCTNCGTGRRREDRREEGRSLGRRRRDRRRARRRARPPDRQRPRQHGGDGRGRGGRRLRGPPGREDPEVGRPSTRSISRWRKATTAPSTSRIRPATGRATRCGSSTASWFARSARKRSAARRPSRSCSSAAVTRTRRKSPGFAPFAPFTRTRPSISGASAALRPIAVVPSTSSTSTSIVRPTFAASRSRLIAACASMKRARRSSRTSSGTAPGSAFAFAPSTGE